MAEAKWCLDCKRLIGIGCACRLTFKEKIEGISVSYEGWAPTNQPIGVPDSYKKQFPNSKLSKDKPPPL